MKVDAGKCSEKAGRMWCVAVEKVLFKLNLGGGRRTGAEVPRLGDWL